MSIGSGALGSTALGGVVTPPTAPPTDDNNLAIVIGFSDYSDRYLLDSLEIVDELGTRTTCDFTLYDATKRLHPEPGELVFIAFNTVILFAGTVEQVEEFAPADNTQFNFVNVTASDLNELADRHVVTARYETANQTLKDVVTAIVNTDSGTDATETLAADRVTLQRVQTGPRLGTIVFNYTTAAEAFDDLAELTGFSWFIDSSRRLNFFDRRTFFAPVPLDESWQEYRNLRVRRNRDQYRNLQYLRAGTAVTASNQTETYTGDGENETFTTKFPIDSIVTVKVNTVAKTVGVRGVVEPGTVDFIYQRGSDTISNDVQATLTASDTLEVVYKGQFPIIIEGKLEEEIERRISQEGGSGIYAAVESDSSVDDQGLAEEKTNALLRRFGKTADTVEFETDRTGFLAGQLLDVDLPQHDIEGQYLITSVRTTRVSDSFFRYRVTAISGENQGNWVDFFKRLSEKGRPFVLRENEKLLIIRTVDETAFVDDVLLTTKSLRPWTEDYFYGVVGNAQTGGTGTDATYGSRVGAPPNIS